MTSTILITKEELYNLYHVQELSARKIAKIFNCDKDTILYKLRKYNIKIKTSSNYRKDQDITNYIFGKLKVISFLERKNGHNIWNCMCTCGRKTKSSYSNIIYNGVNSCGKCNTRYRKYEEISYEFFYRIKKNAKIRNYEFNLTIEQLWMLYLQQNKRCAISGLEISFGSSRDYSDDRTTSLDRIDNSNGYNIDNVQWVHKKINKMKMDLNQNEFIGFCKIISEYQRN